MYVVGEMAPGCPGPHYPNAVVEVKSYYLKAPVDCGNCGTSYNGVVRATGKGPKELYFGYPELIGWETKCVQCHAPVTHTE